MSINSELENSAIYLRQTRNAILGRGGELSTTAGLKDLPTAVYSIPADGNLAYETDDTTAYSKTVPSGVRDFALLDKIGGMTRKSNNLIPYPYYDNYRFKENNTFTVNGLTFTLNTDGTLAVNGTASANTSFNIMKNGSPDLLKGSSFTFSGMSIVGSTSTVFLAFQVVKSDGSFVTGANLVDTSAKSFDYTSEKQAVAAHVNIYIYVYAGTTVNNAVFKPMLNVGTTALPYELYYAGFRASKVTKIVSESKNIFDISKALNANCVDNGDGTYTFKKTSSGRFSVTFPLHIADRQGVCCYMELVEGSDGDSTRIGMQLFDKGMNDVSSMSLVDGGGVYAPKACEYARFYIEASSPVGTYVTFKNPMIAYSGVNVPYAPYFDPITYDIPEEVLAIDGYGEGINDTYYNYIDLTTKEFVRCVDTVVLNGTETWRFNDTVGANYNYFFYNHGKVGIYDDRYILSDDYAPVVIWHTNNVGIDSYNDTNVEGYFRIWVRPHDMNKYTTTQMWDEELAKNPLVIKIPRLTPIREDISDKLGAFKRTIKVQEGGKVKFVNEYGYAVPSTIQYVLEVQ